MRHISPQPLQKKQKYESRIMFQVSACEPARLRNKTEYPLKSVAHHPSRRLRLGTCKEIKRCANAKHHSGNPARVIDDPAFLLGASQSDEQKPRTGISNLFDDTLVFGFTH
jgi:hypothetical protein